MGCWTVIGEGLSRAQEIGAHKTSSNQGEDPVEDDLRRRAFHCLLIFDAQFSGAVGRSPHIHQNVYDTPLPVQPPAPQDDLSSFYALTKIARLQRTTLFSLVSNWPAALSEIICVDMPYLLHTFPVRARFSHQDQVVGPPTDGRAQLGGRQHPVELAALVRRQALSSVKPATDPPSTWLSLQTEMGFCGDGLWKTLEECCSASRPWPHLFEIPR